MKIMKLSIYSDNHQKIMLIKKNKITSKCYSLTERDATQELKL